MFFGWVFFLVSLGGQAPHVLRAQMGPTCEEPNETELAPIGVGLNGLRRVRVQPLLGGVELVAFLVRFGQDRLAAVAVAHEHLSKIAANTQSTLGSMFRPHQ